MDTSFLRPFLGGVIAVLLLAATFVAGIFVGDDDYSDGNSAVQDGPVMSAEPTSCPRAGPRSTRAAMDRVQSCESARAVEQLLIGAGALHANVSVGYVGSNALVGPDRFTQVTAQVFLPEPLREIWDGRQAAEVIARTVGTTVDRVTIVDDRLATIFAMPASVASAPRSTATPAPAPAPAARRH